MIKKSSLCKDTRVIARARTHTHVNDVTRVNHHTRKP